VCVCVGVCVVSLTDRQTDRQTDTDRQIFRLSLKGHSTQKLKFCHHLLILKMLQTCMSLFKMLQTCMSLCLLLNTKEDILKNNGNQTVFWHHTSIVEKNTGKVNGAKDPIVLHNIFLCVQQKTETHTGLQQLEDE